MTEDIGNEAVHARKLSKLLGENHAMAIFETFAEHLDKPLRAPDLETMTDVPHTTVYRLLDTLENTGAITQVGKEGKAVLYRLNMSDPVVRTYATAVMEAYTEALLAEGEMAEDELAEPISIPSIDTFEQPGFDNVQCYPGANKKKMIEGKQGR